MSAVFHIYDSTPERTAVAADLIAAGRFVDFGGYELSLSSSGELIVAILTEGSSVREDIEDTKCIVAERLDTTLRECPALAFLLHLPRRYELVAAWGKGSTWLGYWSSAGFQCGKPPLGYCNNK
jgi:hypothetical protein